MSDDNEEKKKRIQYEISNSEFQKIKAVRAELKKSTMREVIRLALGLLFWYLEQKKKCKKIYTSDENGENIREVELI